MGVMGTDCTGSAACSDMDGRWRAVILIGVCYIVIFRFSASSHLPSCPARSVGIRQWCGFPVIRLCATMNWRGIT